MSVKEQLAQAIEKLPDDLTMEEAVERLLRQLSSWEPLPSWPRKTLADLGGLFVTDEHPPSDADAQCIIEEERLRKHARGA